MPTLLCAIFRPRVFFGGTQHLDGKCNPMQGTSTKKAEAAYRAQFNYAGVTNLFCNTQSAYIACLFRQHPHLDFECDFAIGTNSMQIFTFFKSTSVIAVLMQMASRVLHCKVPFIQYIYPSIPICLASHFSHPKTSCSAVVTSLQCPAEQQEQGTTTPAAVAAAAAAC